MGLGGEERNEVGKKTGLGRKQERGSILEKEGWKILEGMTLVIEALSRRGRFGKASFQREGRNKILFKMNGYTSQCPNTTLSNNE